MPQQFGEFTASELYCPKCKRAQPVRERLLLVLPSGELHEYLCARLPHGRPAVGQVHIAAARFPDQSDNRPS